jgi:hypothetical protein
MRLLGVILRALGVRRTRYVRLHFVSSSLLKTGCYKRLLLVSTASLGDC